MKTNIYTSILDIPFAEERALIINVNTLSSTTLAILSARRYMDMPLLVVDCPLNGKTDIDNLRKLQLQYHFDLLRLPLRHHGDTLDNIFCNLQCEWLYLIDSDVEVLNADALHLMRSMRNYNEISKDKIFGVGLRQVSGFGLPPQERFFHKERMWIPFCCLHVPLVKRVIKDGDSFNICAKPNYSKMGGGIRKVRNRFQKIGFTALARIIDSVMNIFRLDYKERKIDTILYDTGALVYEKLRIKGLHYIDISFYCHPAFVTHFCGITRNLMYKNEPVSTNIYAVEEVIKDRLKYIYQFEYNFFEK